MSSNEEASWREPLDALLNDDRAELERLTAAMDGVGDRVHALSGTVTAAMLNAEMLVDAARGGPASDAGELGDSVRESLKRLRQSIDELKQAVRSARLGRLAPVSPGPTLLALVEQARARLPGLQWVVSQECTIPLQCQLHRGADGFAGPASELLANAAEGRDGLRARRVETVLSFSPQRGHLALEVRDDGPGFPPRLLAAPPRPFMSSKAGRLGLGLVQCFRQARLSGGALSLRNDPAGGAVARVEWAVTDVVFPSLPR